MSFPMLLLEENSRFYQEARRQNHIFGIFDMGWKNLYIHRKVYLLVKNII